MTKRISSALLVLCILLALLPTAVSAAQSEFHTGDIAVINGMIDNNSLRWEKAPEDGSSLPASWSKVIWTKDPPKRVLQLDLYSKNLSGSLDLTGLTALEVVNCGRGRLNSLDVSDLAALKFLFCQENELASLKVSGTALWRLECDRNRLTELDVSGLTTLSLLSCQDNELTGLALHPSAAISNINVSRNFMPDSSAVTGPPVSWGDGNCVFSPQCLRISYYANTGSGEMTPGKAVAGEAFQLPVCEFHAPAVKEFEAWAVGSITGQQVDPLEFYTFEASTTVYALWKDIKLLVHVVDGTAEPEMAAGGTTVTITAEPPGEGERFREWDLSTNVEFVQGTSRTDRIAKFIMPFEEVTATARYEAIRYNTADIAVINGIIDDQGLGWDKAPEDGSSVPDDWMNKVIWVETATDMRVQKLSFADLGLGGVLEIDGLTALEKLYCHGNQLEGLHLSKLPALQVLICHNNELTGLELGDLKALTELICSGNKLDGTLDLSGLESLQLLNCSDNDLDELKLSDLKSLQMLICSGNDLEELDLSDLKSLQELDCSENDLDELDVRGLTGLQELYCYNNSLSGTLDLSGLTALTELNLNSNQLTELVLDGTAQYQNIYVQYNFMADTTAVRGREIFWDNDRFCFYPQTRLVNFTARETGGSEGTADSTGIILSFDRDVNNLQEYVVQVTDGTGSVVIGELSGSGRTWQIELTGVRCEGEVNLNLTPYKTEYEHYDFTGNPQTVTVYRAVPTVTIRYDRNGGNGDMEPDTVRAGAPHELPESRFTAPAKKCFMAWAIGRLDGTQKQPGETHAFELDTTLYALWKEIPDPYHIAVFRAGYQTQYYLGETVDLAARAEGGVAPCRYQFFVIGPDGTKTILRNYAYSNIFKWTPVTAGEYRVGVDVTDADGKSRHQEKEVSILPQPEIPLAAAVFRTGKQSVYNTGDRVALAARAEGGTGPYRYSFYVLNAGNEEQLLRDYAYSNICNWVPDAAGEYRVGVRIKDAQSAVVNQVRTVEVRDPAAVAFHIAVFRAGFREQYESGETIALAARAEGGRVPYRYQFYVVNSSGTKKILRDYAYSNIFSWIPEHDDEYEVHVAVKDGAGNVLDEQRVINVGFSG